MLVLARKLNESIRIGSDITITILGVDEKRRAVRIGIEAPDDIIVLRTELIGRDMDRRRGRP